MVSVAVTRAATSRSLSLSLSLAPAGFVSESECVEIRGCCWESATGDCFFSHLPRGVSLQCQAGGNNFACGKIITILLYNRNAVMMIIYICGINDPFLYHAGASNDSYASEVMCAGAGCCWNEVAMPHSSACTIVHYDLYLAPIFFSCRQWSVALLKPQQSTT